MNLQTCCNISLNCCSIGEHFAEMTGSLCRHTAASKRHGEVAFSITLLVCKVCRQKDVLNPWQKTLFLDHVLLNWERIGITARLAILLQGAAIFFAAFMVSSGIKVPLVIARKEPMFFSKLSILYMIKVERVNVNSSLFV